jgi:hypothetical protein
MHILVWGHYIRFYRLDVLTAALVKIQVFCYMTPCRLVNSSRRCGSSFAALSVKPFQRLKCSGTEVGSSKLVLNSGYCLLYTPSLESTDIDFLGRTMLNASVFSTIHVSSKSLNSFILFTVTPNWNETFSDYLQKKYLVLPTCADI